MEHLKGNGNAKWGWNGTDKVMAIGVNNERIKENGGQSVFIHHTGCLTDLCDAGMMIWPYDHIYLCEGETSWITMTYILDLKRLENTLKEIFWPSITLKF